MAFRKQEKKLEKILKQKIIYREKTYHKRIKHFGYRTQRYKKPYYILLSDNTVYEVHKNMQFVIRNKSGSLGYISDKLRFERFIRDYEQYFKNKGDKNEQ